MSINITELDASLTLRNLSKEEKRAVVRLMELSIEETKATMQARIEKLENVAEKLANIIQWAMDDEEDFTYSAEGMVAIAELDTLKGDK